MKLSVGTVFPGKYETRLVVAVDDYFGYVKYEVLNPQGKVMHSRGQRDVTIYCFTTWVLEQEEDD